MYAIISTGGKQLKVTNDEVVAVERIAGNAGDKVVFDQVLAVGEGASLNVGTPTVAGAKVEAEIVEHFRGPKLISKSNAVKATACAKGTDRNSPESKFFLWGNLPCVMMQTELCLKPKSRE